MFENPEAKNSCLLTQRIYNTSDGLEVDRIRKKIDITKFYKLVIHESKSRGKHIIDYYRKLTTIKKILIITKILILLIKIFLILIKS